MSGLRIGTFNTHLDSVLFEIGKDPLGFFVELSKSVADPISHPNPFVKHVVRTKYMAERIAERIVNGTMPGTETRYDYDVIALNEVFSEDARIVLLNNKDLKTTFPFRIDKLPAVVPPLPHFLLSKVETFLGEALDPLLRLLGIDWHDLGEDSGLMLLSRYPIVKSDFRIFEFVNDEEVEFAMFDSLAAKGAAYVRISNPETSETFNLVFAHLQENKDEWTSIRENQLRQTKELIKSVMTDTMITEEDVFVVGDLNVIGNWNYRGDLPKPPNDIINDIKREGGAEWKYHFNNPESFFTNSIHDTGFYETSTKDEGPKTGGGIGSRLDYILHNTNLPSDTQWKVQHLTKAYNLMKDGTSLSDHFGLNADLNHYTEHCNPRDAQVIGRTSSVIGRGIVTRRTSSALERVIELEGIGHKPTDINIASTLKFPGSMVWYRLDEPGTYSVAVRSTKGIEFIMYHNSDLSLPLGQYKDETTEFTDEREIKFIAKKYVLAEPPYYIRVYHPDRSVTDDFKLFIHKHRGVDSKDAIVLIPHKEEGGPDVGWFPENEVLNPDDTVWFQFNTLGIDRESGGVPQDIFCEVSSYSEPAFHMTLLEADAKTVISTTRRELSKLTLGFSDPGPSLRYLTVTRDSPSHTNKFNIKWTTNLTVFHSQFVQDYPIPSPKGPKSIDTSQEPMLKCENETDPESGGSDQIQIRIWVDGKERASGYLGEFEKDSSAGLTKLIPDHGFRYLSEIKIQLWELDVGPDDPSNVLTIRPLTEHRTQRWEIGDPKFDFEDGIYSIVFNRSAQLTSS